MLMTLAEYKARLKYEKSLEIANEKLVERLDKIADIIESVDHRCSAADGPVTPKLQEMTQDEMSEIWRLADLPKRSLRLSQVTP